MSILANHVAILCGEICILKIILIHIDDQLGGVLMLYSRTWTSCSVIDEQQLRSCIEDASWHYLLTGQPHSLWGCHLGGHRRLCICSSAVAVIQTLYRRFQRYYCILSWLDNILMSNCLVLYPLVSPASFRTLIDSVCLPTFSLPCSPIL